MPSTRLSVALCFLSGLRLVMTVDSMLNHMLATNATNTRLIIPTMEARMRTVFLPVVIALGTCASLQDFAHRASFRESPRSRNHRDLHFADVAGMDLERISQ